MCQQLKPHSFTHIHHSRGAHADPLLHTAQIYFALAAEAGNEKKNAKEIELAGGGQLTFQSGTPHDSQ